MKHKILAHLQKYGEANTSFLANLVDAPEASVRRTIQTLRREGYNISFNDGYGYRLYSKNG
jgi:biotin operon repressor